MRRCARAYATPRRCARVCAPRRNPHRALIPSCAQVKSIETEGLRAELLALCDKTKRGAFACVRVQILSDA